MEIDSITLNGLGVETHWIFPNVTLCPYKPCRRNMKTRSNAIEHYKSKHAHHVILCPLCDTPISAHVLDDFKEHYLHLHPNDPLPYDLDNSVANNQKKMSSSSFQKVQISFKITMDRKLMKKIPALYITG